MQSIDLKKIGNEIKVRRVKQGIQQTALAEMLDITQTEYNFNMLSEKYQNEQKELETKIRQLHAMMEAAVQTAADADKWIALMLSLIHIRCV